MALFHNIMSNRPQLPIPFLPTDATDNAFFYMPWLPVVAPQAEVKIPVPISELENKRKYKRSWNKAQVEELYAFTKDYCEKNGKSLDDLQYADFEIIANYTSQTPRKCMAKILEIKTSGTLRAGVWSAAEDELLVQLLSAGKKKWGVIAEDLNIQIHKGLKLRTGKHCKERWNNHLNPEIKRGPWTLQEDINLLEAHKKLGNRWSQIAKLIAFRTESSIKNRVKSLLNKEKQELDNLDNPQVVLDRLIMKKKFEIANSGTFCTTESASPPSGADYGLHPNKKPSFSFMAMEVCQNLNSQ